jgi:16S rRNA (cytosine1402-N4)-methyltransferase
MYHQPVMLSECLEGLNIKPDGVYVDVTFGGGGHSKAILAQLGDRGKLFAFDQDSDARANAEMIADRRLTFVDANFRYLQKYLRLYGASTVDGILGDLGVSSHQFDTARRGFSTRYDAKLDMRMNQRSDLTAHQVLNEYSEADLHKIFGMYGEVHNARTLASAIISTRPIHTIDELKSVLQRYAHRGKENKYFAQVFQAVRIEVNDELGVLQDFLSQSVDVLKPDGRLVVMAYHSLEDRLVKNFINKGKFHGEVDKDLYGNEIKPLQAVNRKPIEPTDDEVALNPRARSAKLRIAGKSVER